MTVTSIRYQPVEGGSLSGHFALHVALGSYPGALSFTSTELSSKIHEAFETLNLTQKAIKGVLIDCRGESDLSEMSSLLGTLREWRMYVVLWVKDDTRYPWFEFASYITVFVKNVHWANFRVNEIRYPFANDEPDIYEVNANVPSYIETEDLTASSVLSFVTTARRPWGVILPTKSVAVIDFMKVKA